MRFLWGILAGLWLFAGALASADEITPSDAVRSAVIIREGPSTQSDRLGSLLPGETLELLSDATPLWFEVRLADGRTGWVSKRWTERIATAAPSEPLRPMAGERRAEMFAHFVFVGQGDATILEFPCGVAVIDVGGQYQSDTDGGREFGQYLDAFFDARPHLDRTIDVLFLSHAHTDHIDGVDQLTPAPDYRLAYTIDNIVDNGLSEATGPQRRQRDFRNRVIAAQGNYFPMRMSRQYTNAGVHNDTIDPIDCSDEFGVDPVITLHWGSFDRDTIRALGGVGAGAGNPNNHSLVIRVDFRDASFLFTGDLMTPGIRDLVRLHQSRPEALDVDIYHVGHHGADNGTTDPLLQAMSPKMAIISMGLPGERGGSTAHDHGHPRRSAIEMMQTLPGIVSEMRDDPRMLEAFDRQGVTPRTIRVERAIYGTGWRGRDLVLRATTEGEYEFVDPPD